MKTLETMHHKMNEIQDVVFFKNEECTEAFDFTSAKNIYIVPKEGDFTFLLGLCQKFNKFLDDESQRVLLCIPYIADNMIDGISVLRRSMYGTKTLPITKTLDDIAPNLSKYIPEDNAVLFLSEEDTRQYISLFPQRHCSKFIKYDKFLESEWIVNRVNKGIDITTKKITIFLPYGTQSKIQEVEEVAKELMEKCGVEEVNLFALHCFVREINWFYKENGNFSHYKIFFDDFGTGERLENINKIITTNSTGILPVEDSERLQVIDAKEIFEEYLNN